MGKRFFNYLRNEGLRATISKITMKIICRNNNNTLFFQMIPSKKFIEVYDKMEIEELTKNNQHEFEKIKFWDFIDAREYIENPNQSILMVKKDGRYLAYAAEQHEIVRHIHKLGCFSLDRGEAWIGPVFVCKNYRGKGLGTYLIRSHMRLLMSKQVTTFYTAVNSQNFASRRSFEHIGFSQIGIVDKKRNVTDDVLGVLHVKFKQECTSKK